MKYILMLVAVLLFGSDSLNRNVGLKNYNRIIAIGPGALRMVVYLQAQDKIVGIEKKESNFIYARPYILANKFLLKLPKIGMGGPNLNINLEAIRKLKPDLIVAGFISKEKADEIEKKTGSKVFVVKYGMLGNYDEKSFKKALFKLAEVLNKQNRAKEIEKFLDNLKFEKINTDKKLYIGGVAFKGIHGLTSTIGEYLPFKLLGLKNIVDSPAQVFVNEEFLYKSQPDIIFVDESALKLIDFNKYSYLKAFRNHKVFGLLPYNNYMTNVESAYANAFYIQKVLGKNIDAEKKAAEIYKFFVGKNVYPQMKKFFGGFRKLY